MIHNKTYAVTVSHGADLETPPKADKVDMEREAEWPADFKVFKLPVPVIQTHQSLLREVLYLLHPPERSRQMKKSPISCLFVLHISGVSCLQVFVEIGVLRPAVALPDCYWRMLDISTYRPSYQREANH